MFPSSIHVAATAAVVRALSRHHMEHSLARKGSQLAGVVKAGRTTQVTDACRTCGEFCLGSIGRPRPDRLTGNRARPSCVTGP